MAWLRPKDIQDVQFRISEFMVEKAITLVSNMDVPFDIYPSTPKDISQGTQKDATSVQHTSGRQPATLPSNWPRLTKIAKIPKFVK